MATTKIWKVVKRLDYVADYAKNENKTKNDYLENRFDKYEDIRQVVMYATNSDKTEKQLYGISVLEEKTCKSGINYNNFYQKSLQNSDYYKFAKEDIDYAIKHSYTSKDFHRILNSMGYSYYYRADKLSIRKELHKRNIRVKRTFGEEYYKMSLFQKKKYIHIKYRK